jgi:hypothetical protein
MADDSGKPCDVDDVLCQMVALSHLKGLRDTLGDDRYRTEFPELEGLGQKIASREEALRETLGRCGMAEPAEITETDEQEE